MSRIITWTCIGLYLSVLSLQNALAQRQAEEPRWREIPRDEAAFLFGWLESMQTSLSMLTTDPLRARDGQQELKWTFQRDMVINLVASMQAFASIQETRAVRSYVDDVTNHLIRATVTSGDGNDEDYWRVQVSHQEQVFAAVRTRVHSASVAVKQAVSEIALMPRTLGVAVGLASAGRLLTIDRAPVERSQASLRSIYAMRQSAGILLKKALGQEVLITQDSFLQQADELTHLVNIDLNIDQFNGNTNVWVHEVGEQMMGYQVVSQSLKHYLGRVIAGVDFVSGCSKLNLLLP